MNQPAHCLPHPERLRLRVADFELLADNGAFADHGKTELIDGDIYVMNAQFSRHARMKSRLFLALASQLAAIGGDLEAISEVSVHLSDDSMPEPDIVLTRWQGDRAVPVASVALIVEIADTTLETDLGRKADLYAAAGVPEYWVLDMTGERVLMHEQPTAAGYRARRETALDRPLASATIAGLVITPAGLLR